MLDRENAVDAYQEGLKHARDNFDDQVILNACPSADILSFEILALLGTGGFGEVYRAQRDERLYAIKRIFKRTVRLGRNQELLIREKKYQYAIDSKFTVKLISKFKCRHYLYLVMEAAEYGDLYDFFLNFGEPLGEPMSRSITVQIVLGIEYLHACDIVYRDMKPENVVLFEGGRVKICDFGLAVQSSEKLSETVGTGIFLAPEQNFSRQYDGAVDWWALGITVCEFLLGRYPFGPPHLSEEQKQRISPTAPIEGLDDVEISVEAKDFIRRLLDKNNESRLGSGVDGSIDVKQHPWLRGVDYYSVLFEDRQFALDEGNRHEGDEPLDDRLKIGQGDEADPDRADFDEF